MREQILKLPKVELHSHLEGTIKPHLVHQIAQRNGIELDQNLFDNKGGYVWSDFPSFLVAYDGASFCLKNKKTIEILCISISKTVPLKMLYIWRHLFHQIMRLNAA